MQEFEELLVFFGRGGFEFSVPALHLVFGESAGLHDGDPLLLGDHVCLSQSPGPQQTNDGLLVGAELVDLGVQFYQTPLEDPGRVTVAEGTRREDCTNVVESEAGIAVGANGAQALCV